MTLKLESPAFTHEGEIPREHTCEGAGTSPPLRWSGAPVETRSLVLIIEDPDAPDPRAPRTVWTHWVAFNLPAGDGELEAGGSSNLPEGAQTGLNDWRRFDYGGPCPPIGRHRYFHRLLALDTRLENLRGPPTQERVEEAARGHVLEEAVLIGTYQRS